MTTFNFYIMTPHKNPRRDFIRKGASLAALSAAGIALNSAPLKTMKTGENIEFCTSYFFGLQEQKLALSRQMGVTGAVAPPSPRYADMREKNGWDIEVIAAVKERFKKEGLDWRVVEGPPTLEKTKLGLDGRDEEIDNFITFVKNIGKLGIDVVCYNWMPVISWHRTATERLGRGGALMTAFDYEDIKDQPMTEYGEVSAETMWRNLEYFLKALVPECEKANVKLALHPDDPPIDNIRGISRIMTSANAFKRLIELVPSPVNGITLCQGTFATMGEDIPSVIRYFGERDKIFFVHFRDIRGDKYNFEEVFQDDGITDMYKAMKLYHQLGFRGPMRPDHVATVAGDSNDHPGYSILGNLFAIGYMRGLLEAVQKEA